MKLLRETDFAIILDTDVTTTYTSVRQGALQIHNSLLRIRNSETIAEFKYELLRR